MGSPYDILIQIQAKAQEVAEATAAISTLVEKVTSSGGAVSAGMAQGQAAVNALSRDIESASAVAGQLGNEGKAAGTGLASGMNQGSAAAQKTAASVRQAGEETEKVSELAKEAGHSWERFGSSLQDALTFGFGTELAQKAIEVISEIPKLFAESIEKGVEFDKEIETSTIGLAATFRSVSPEKYLNFSAAREAGEVALSALQSKANTLGVDFHSLAEAYSANLRALIEGGVTQPEKQIELVSTLIQAATSKGVTGMQALKDSIDILNGRAGNIVLAKELGLESQALKEAAQNGQLYELIMSKIGGYREAAVATANSFAGVQQTVANLLQQLEGTAAAPVFDTTKKALLDIRELLESVEAKGAAKGTGLFLSDMINGSKMLIPLLVQIGKEIPIIKETGEALHLLFGGYYDEGKLAAYQQANAKIIDSIRDQIANAKTDFDQDQARANLARQILATQQLISQSEGVQKTAAEGLLDALVVQKEDFDILVGKGRDAESAAHGMTNALHASNEELSGMLAKLPDIIAGMQQAAHAADLANRLAGAANTTAKIGILTGEREDQLKKINDIAAKLGSGGITDSSQIATVLSAINAHQTAQPYVPKGGPNMLGVAAGGTPAATDRITDASAVEDIAKANQALVKTDQEILALKRQASEEDKKSAASASDRAQQEAIFAARARGDKTHADQLERAKDINTEALRISKDEGKTWDESVRDATRYVDLQNQAKDAADAEKKSKKDSAAAGKEAAAAAREQHQEELAADRDRKTALMNIRDELAELKSNPFLTAGQKAEGEKRLLLEELALLEKNISERQRLIALYQNTPGKSGDVSRLQQENVGDQHTANQNKQQMALLGGGGQIKAQLVQLQNQWGTTSQAIGRTITQNIQTAVDGVSNAIDGLIEGTHNWRQAFAQTGSAIIKSLIQLGVQMVVNAVLGKTLGKSAATEQATNNATITSTGAAAAAVTSISSYGVAAIVGVAAAVAAIAAIIAMATSHASGGLIPGQPSHRDNRMAHVASGEYVVRTAAVQHYGPEFFHRLNSMSVPRTGFASGGLVGDRDGYTPILATMAGNGAPSVNVGGSRLTLIQTRDRNEMLQALQSTEGKKIVLGHVKGNRTDLGIKS